MEIRDYFKLEGINMSKYKTLAFILPIIIVFSFFFLYPLVVLVVNSLHNDQGFTFVNYTQMITNAYYFKALLNSIILSILVTLATLVVSGVLAFFLARHNFPGKSLYFTLLTFPISFPGVVVGFMIIILFGSTGLIPMSIQKITGQSSMVLAYTIFGIFLAYLYFSIPRTIMMLFGAIKDFDYTLEEAARTIGATSGQAIRYVILPAVMPIFTSAGAIAFSTSMSAFGTAFTLSNQFDILPILMYTEFTLNFNIEVASAIAVVIGIIVVTINSGYQAVLKKGGALNDKNL